MIALWRVNAGKDFRGFPRFCYEDANFVGYRLCLTEWIRPGWRPIQPEGWVPVIILKAKQLAQDYLLSLRLTSCFRGFHNQPMAAEALPGPLTVKSRLIRMATTLSLKRIRFAMNASPLIKYSLLGVPYQSNLKPHPHKPITDRKTNHEPIKQRHKTLN